MNNKPTQNTILQNFIHHYLEYKPPLQSNELNLLEKYMLLLLATAETECRLYLGGVRNNLKPVSHCIEELMRLNPFTQWYTKYMMLNVEAQLSNYDIHEFVPKHQEAKKKILEFIENVPAGNEDLPSFPGCLF